MRLEHVAFLLLASACAGDEREPAVDFKTAGSCDVEETVRELWSATQTIYDYQPLALADLASRSSTIVRGTLASVKSLAGEHPSTLIEVSVERAYKGESGPGQRVLMKTSRAPFITAGDLARVERQVRGRHVTVFLLPATALPGVGSTEREVFDLTTPQGLVVTSDCGIQPAFDSAPIVGADVENEAELDAVLQSVL